MAGSLKNICEEVEIDGKYYRVNTDFRVWIEIERLLFDKRISDETRFAEILVLAYPLLPPNPYAAIDRVMWFYSGGGLKSEASAKGQKSPAFDLTEDFDYIWAAFLGEFGIDFLKESLHWWKFRTLIGALSDRSLFSRIVGYRTVDLLTIRDKEQRRFFEKMKRRFRLEPNEDAALRDEEVAEKLAAVFD